MWDDRTVIWQFVCGNSNTTVATVVEGPQCTFTLRLVTLVACIEEPRIYSCVFDQPKLGMSWDLSSMASSQDNQAKSVTGAVYSIQMCGASKQMMTPCGRDNNSACVYAPSGAFVIGLGGMALTPRGISYMGR